MINEFETETCVRHPSMEGLRESGRNLARKHDSRKMHDGWIMDECMGWGCDGLSSISGGLARSTDAP